MYFKGFIILLFSILLISCDGEEVQSLTKTTTPVTLAVPTLSINVDSTSVNEGSTITITTLAQDYQLASLDVDLSCDLGVLDGNNFTAPSVASETIVTCTATATDSGNKSITETLTLIVNTVTPVLVLSNGATGLTTAKLISIDVFFADIKEGLIDATLNNKAIKLAITPDKQLVYFPPMGSIGLQTLALTIEGEIITYEYKIKASNVSYDDANIYVNEFLFNMQDKIEKMIQADILAGAPIANVSQLKILKEYYNQNSTMFISMTNEEKEYLASFIYENSNFLERK